MSARWAVFPRNMYWSLAGDAVGHEFKSTVWAVFVVALDGTVAMWAGESDFDGFDVCIFVVFFEALEGRFFVILFEECRVRSDQEIDWKTEDRREDHDQEDREYLEEDIGRSVGDVFDDPDDHSEPDDESVDHSELEREVEGES